MPLPKREGRLVGSCDSCRKLKRACDSKIPCTICVLRGSECSYNSLLSKQFKTERACRACKAAKRACKRDGEGACLPCQQKGLACTYGSSSIPVAIEAKGGGGAAMNALASFADTYGDFFPGIGPRLLSETMEIQRSPEFHFLMNSVMTAVTRVLMLDASGSSRTLREAVMVSEKCHFITKPFVIETFCLLSFLSCGGEDPRTPDTMARIAESLSLQTPFLAMGSLAVVRRMRFWTDNGETTAVPDAAAQIELTEVERKVSQVSLSEWPYGFDGGAAAAAATTATPPIFPRQFSLEEIPTQTIDAASRLTRRASELAIATPPTPDANEIILSAFHRFCSVAFSNCPLLKSLFVSGHPFTIARKLSTVQFSVKKTTPENSEVSLDLLAARVNQAQWMAELNAPTGLQLIFSSMTWLVDLSLMLFSLLAGEQPHIIATKLATSWTTKGGSNSVRLMCLHSPIGLKALSLCLALSVRCDNKNLLETISAILSRLSNVFPNAADALQFLSSTPSADPEIATCVVFLPAGSPPEGATLTHPTVETHRVTGQKIETEGDAFQEELSVPVESPLGCVAEDYRRDLFLFPSAEELIYSKKRLASARSLSTGSGASVFSSFFADDPPQI